MEAPEAVDLKPWTSHLSLSPEGIWVSAQSSPVSYHSEDNDNYFRIEAESFWFQHRNQCLAQVMRHFPPAGVLFDVGGGNGFVSWGLNQEGFPTVLVEPGPAGARNGRKRGVKDVICATYQDAGFPDHSLPAVGLFDVIEHIEDDHGFLRSLKTKLVEGGRIFFTVPTYQWLWSAEDPRAGHYRRYTRPGMKTLLEAEGFQVEYATYFFSFLVFPLFLARALPYRLGFRPELSGTQNLSEHRTPGGPGQWVLRQLMKWERQRMGRGTIPAGTSLIVVAKS
jgi:SAM-dependent methyltransferase